MRCGAPKAEITYLDGWWCTDLILSAGPGDLDFKSIVNIIYNHAPWQARVWLYGKE